MKSFTSISIAAKFAIVCISLFASFTLKTNACGPDFTGWQFSWLLEHYNYQHPLFDYQFDPSNRFYSKSWAPYTEEREAVPDKIRHNLSQWRTYLKLPLSIHDTVIRQFIYHDSNLALQKQSPISKFIDTKSNAEEIWQYLLLMNAYKNELLPSDGIWDYSSYTNVVGYDTVATFTAKCERMLQSSKEPFVKWRLLYLILRATHFNKYHDKAAQAFETYYPMISQDHSLAQYWCEGMYAGALLRMKQYDKAIYYSARAFANCPDQKMEAMNTYLFSNRNWKSALPLCKDASDSVYVAMLEGANEPLPNMEFANMVYQKNPGSEILKFLWLREAHKMEEYWLTKNKYETKNIHYLDYDHPIDMDSFYVSAHILSQFIELSNSILHHNGNIPAKVSVANSLAYYYYKTGDYEKAQNLLEKITSLPKDEIERKQFELLSALLHLKKSNQLETEKFVSLIQYFKSIASGQTNNHVGYYLLYNEIAPYYLAKKDTLATFWTYTYANCFDADSFHLYASDYSPESFNYSNYATYLLNQQFSIETVQQLKQQFLARKGRTEFETYLIQGTKFDEGATLFDLVIARKHMLAERWDQALSMYDALPASFTTIMGPNPANSSINDYMEDAGQKNSYTIKQILELALKLKSNADKVNEGNATDKLLYATVLYNLSFYGKNHYILDNHWNQYGSNAVYYDFDSIDTHIYCNDKDYYEMPFHKSYQNYFRLTASEKYAKDALMSLKTAEEKAQATFLLAKCWQKRCPRKTKFNTEYKYWEDVSDYVGYSLKNPLLQKTCQPLLRIPLCKNGFSIPVVITKCM
ncbi:MAG: hypothetical protein IPK62_00560 [Bacteroidetes bacterium]|nr:hypothetical protein [Bacteroidota bacterium]